MRSSSLSAICDGNTFLSCPGSAVKVLYTPALVDGELVLNETGKFDIAEFINSYADSTDMAFILSRLAAGDSSVLNVQRGFFGDASILPDDHRAALDTVISAQVYFDNLPQETRDKFNDSFVEWIQSAGTSDWVSRMSANNVSCETSVSPESEVKSDEP